MEEVLISGVALNMGEAKVTIFGVPDRPGVAAKIFQHIAEHEINVDMILQNKTETKTTDISFTVMKSDLKRALHVVRQAARSVKARDVNCDEHIAKVSLVGLGMRTHPGVASKMFGALAKRGINIEMISTSDIRISCVVNGRRGKDAMRAIHRAFALHKNNVLTS